MELKLDSLSFIENIIDKKPDIVLDKLEGATLGERFLIGEFLGKG